MAYINNTNKILKLSKHFERVATSSAQAGDIQQALENANLWKLDYVYDAIDKADPEFSGHVTGVLSVKPSGFVSITVTGTKAKSVKNKLTTHLRRMSAALKKSKTLPAGLMDVPWFENTGYK